MQKGDSGRCITRVEIRRRTLSYSFHKTIAQARIDLLVMLAHEEGRLEELFFQRSNDELVRKMPCSVMLVKKEPGAIGEGEE